MDEFDAYSETARNNEVYPIFISCIEYFRWLGRSFFMSQVVLRTIRETTREAGVVLPVEAWDILNTYNGADWIANALKTVESAYPPGRVAQDAEGSRLDDLLKSWDDFSLADSIVRHT